jgi:hypothetical protein
MSVQDSQASFSATAKSTIRRMYRNRCTICLTKLTPEGGQCAPLFDSSARGKYQVSRQPCVRFIIVYGLQVDQGIELGTISADYVRSTLDNGIIRKHRHLSATRSETLIRQNAPPAIWAFLDRTMLPSLRHRK